MDMKEQVIISVGREFGSAGHIIAKELAQRFEIPYYDHNLLEHVAQEKEVDHDTLKKYDERPKNKLFYRTVGGHSNSPEENVAQMQFEYLRKMAEEGKSFVIVGRCAETILKDYPGLISIFILGDQETKLQRVMERHNVSKEEAKQIMKRGDWKRKSYHNYHCKGKWGDSRNYDLSVNSSKLGIEKTTDMLERYIKERMNW